MAPEFVAAGAVASSGSSRVAVAWRFFHRVQDHGDRDAMQPRRQDRLATKLVQPVERPHEDVLRQVLGQLGATRHAQCQPEDPVDVLLIDLSLDRPIARFRHAAHFPALSSRTRRRHSRIGHWISRQERDTEERRHQPD